MKTLEKLFAEKLLKIQAIKLQPANPFTWASGWKDVYKRQIHYMTGNNYRWSVH